VAVGADPLEAYQRAFECDPMSAYGGVICLNRRVDRPLAEALVNQFIEVLFAPGYDEDALEVLATKRNMRVLDAHGDHEPSVVEADLRQVMGGMLVEDPDEVTEGRSEMEVVSARQPTDEEWDELLFAWKVCKHVRSNAIVVSRGLASLGIGAGQMSRVDSVRLALEKARTGLEGAVMASDAFFPFSDGPELAIEAGVTAIIQPGGSIRDQDVIAAADAAGAAMVFTSRRHFRH
jgi:phosphoribosylaminoimidazolecarboxamide formyltransferase/IMP cyclohydrolase